MTKKGTLGDKNRNRFAKYCIMPSLLIGWGIFFSQSTEKKLGGNQIGGILMKCKSLLIVLLGFSMSGFGAGIDSFSQRHLKRLENGTIDERVSAAIALSESGESVVIALIHRASKRVVKSEDQLTRMAATTALILMGQPARSALEDLLKRDVLDPLAAHRADQIIRQIEENL